MWNLITCFVPCKRTSPSRRFRFSLISRFSLGIRSGIAPGLFYPGLFSRSTSRSKMSNGNKKKREFVSVHLEWLSSSSLKLLMTQQVCRVKVYFIVEVFPWKRPGKNNFEKFSSHLKRRIKDCSRILVRGKIFSGCASGNPFLKLRLFICQIRNRMVSIAIWIRTNVSSNLSWSLC